MGYPLGWTDIEKDDIDLSNRYPAAWLDGSWDAVPRLAVKQNHWAARTRALGNAVIPHIPALLWRMTARAFM
jgi:hypothetical protein